MSIADDLKASILTEQRERRVKAFNDGYAQKRCAEVEFQKRRVVELRHEHLYPLTFPNGRQRSK